ncbi:MAG: DUF2490 domain-containing protein [Chitinophagaceae bacterium]|nr:MAG: DUF2490 domain-containing protein [Chitinophagaceae bacterium]
MRNLLIVFIIVLSPVVLWSQKNYLSGTLTQANIDFKVNKSWKLNVKLESRQIFSEREPGSPKSNKFRYERTDMALVLTRKISADNTIGGGYLARLEDGKLAHRLIQQFNHVRKLDVVRLAHRVVADQTFRSDEANEYRLRYRLSAEVPFNGFQIDPKEFYGKASNEYLGIWSDQSPDLEIRGSVVAGYNASDDNKIELGLEYRVNEFNKNVNAQQFWVTIVWYLSI